MTPVDLAKEISSNPRWEWDRGQRVSTSYGVGTVVGWFPGYGGYVEVCIDDPPNSRRRITQWEPADIYPVIEAETTKGSMVCMLRKAWTGAASPDVCARYNEGREGAPGSYWYAGSGGEMPREGMALADGLIAAWRMAPEETEET